MSLEDKRVKNKTILISPLELKNQLPISDKTKEFILQSRINIKNILNNENNRLVVIVGPCSIHDYGAALEYAKFLKSQKKKYSSKLEIVMRTYFSKPRTIIGWKGFIYDSHLDGSFNISEGLFLARKLLIEILDLGIACSMEHVDTIIPQYFDDLLSYGAIGARTSESQIHRELASGISTPIGFKNGTSGNIDIAINAIKCANNEHTFLGTNYEGNICSVETLGNPLGHLILRGGTNGPNYYEKNILESIKYLEKSKVNTSIIVDCSHGNSLKKHKNQIIVCENIAKQIKNGNTNIKGVMIESNLLDGNQNIDCKPLIYGKSVTDACINLDDTDKMHFTLFCSLDG